MSEWFGAEDCVNRALDHYERGRWSDAEAELRKALAVEPDRGEWQFNLGLTLDAASRPIEALECYLRAAQLMPDDVQPLLAAGATANRLDRHEQAVELLEGAALRHTGDDSAHAMWIDSLICLDRLDEAETVFHLAQQSIESCPRALAAVAESLMRREQWARAEWCLREAMRLEPGLPRLRARLAAVFAATGRAEKAVQLYWREMRDDPGSVDTMLDFGDLLAQLNRLPEATEKFRRVLEIEPANVEAHRRLGELAMRTSGLEQAHLEFELVSRLDPDAPQIRLDLADCLLAMGRTDEAAAQLQRELDGLSAEECDPDVGRLGALLLRAGRPAPAIPLLERAAEEAGDDASVVDVLRQLALARYESGDLVGGMLASRRVLRHDPRCKRSRHNLALACLRLGRLRRAAACVRVGLRLDAHDEDLRRLRARVWVARLRRWLGV